MIKLEFKRALESISFKIALLIGLVISFAQVVFHTMPIYADPLKGVIGANTYPRHLLECFMGADTIMFYSTFVRLLPILCTMAYGISFVSDYNSGYIKNIVICKRRREYYNAKFICVFVIGGLVAVIPIVINILFTACLVPAMPPFLGHGGIRNGFYYAHPIIYIFTMLIRVFLYAGAFSTISLAGAFVVRNRFLLSILPYVIWYALAVISNYIMGNSYIGVIAPEGLISLRLALCKPVVVWGEWLIIATISYILFVRKGEKLDVL